MQHICNGVFEGGGVRGIGHVGAASVLEESGYRFASLAGSSAGAIVASLLVCGYSADELEGIMRELDYSEFRQEGLLASLGVPGKLVGLATGLGVYSSQRFEDWLAALLGAKGCRFFGDIPTGRVARNGCKWRLIITASDVTDNRLLILPRDLALFGIEPDSFPIAQAVRMSMSIPLYFKPCKLTGADGRTHLVVDGGLLSNYPLWLFDDDNCPSPYPTIGFKFVSAGERHKPRDEGRSPSLPEYLRLLGKTALDAADKQHIAEDGGDFARTVAIPVGVRVDGETQNIRSTDFDITQQESRLLFQNGREAAQRFLAGWNYEDWKRRFKATTPAARQHR